MKLIKIERNGRPNEAQRKAIKQARNNRKAGRGRQWVAAS